MSLLNFSTNLTAYADALKNQNPSVKFTDLKWSMLGLPTDNPQMIPITLAPGTTQTIMSSTRAISFNGSTSFVIATVPGTSDAQVQVSIGQRTGRSDGDATSQWQFVRTNTLVQMMWTGTGTAPDFSTMSIGDWVTIEEPFNQFNQGDFAIVNINVAGNYIEFVNPIGTNETVVGQVDIYSNGPVQVGDILDISNPIFSFPNQGQFKITRVTDTFIQFCNQKAVPETITGITTGFVIYPVASKWMLMAVDHKIVVAFNGDTGTGCEIEPPVDCNIHETPGLLIKRGKVYQLKITNPGLTMASGFVFLAE